MSDLDLIALRARLVARRRRLRARMDGARERAEAAIEDREAEAVESQLEQVEAATLYDRADADAAAIAEVDAALRRMDDGSYGRCTACGAPIDPARLAALPETPVCRDDAEPPSGP